jgi:hypothetical protein
VDAVSGETDAALDQVEIGGLGFWKMKVMTKRPTARTVQMEASDSSAVSCSSCWGAVVVFGSALSGVVAVISGNFGSPRAA